jgi:hypothetical protein
VPGSKWVGPTSTVEGFAEVDAEATGFSAAVADVGGGVAGLLTYPDKSVALARVAKDGSVAGPWEIPGLEQAVSMSVDSSGRHLVAALAQVGGVRVPVVVRLLGDGALDPSFGATGVAELPAGVLGTYATGGLTIDGEGRILVTTHPTDRVNFRDVYVRSVMWRLAADGSVDRAFGTDGSVEMGTEIFPTTSSIFPDYLHVGPSGAITAVVRTNVSDRLVRQYLADGEGLNPVYGNGGSVDIAASGLPASTSYPGTWFLRGVVFRPDTYTFPDGVGLTVSLTAGVFDPVTSGRTSRAFVVAVSGNGRTGPGYLSQPVSGSLNGQGADLSAGSVYGSWIPSTYVRPVVTLGVQVGAPQPQPIPTSTRLVSGIQLIDRFGANVPLVDDQGTVRVESADGFAIGNCAPAVPPVLAASCVPGFGPIGVRGLDGDFFLLGAKMKAGVGATVGDLAVNLDGGAVAKLVPALATQF